MPIEFFQKIVKNSDYFHSSKYYTFSKVISANPENLSVTFYWQNDDYVIRLYNRTFKNYKDSSISKYIILRIELDILNFKEIFNQLKRKRRNLKNNFRLLFDEFIQTELRCIFREKLQNIFPPPPPNKKIDYCDIKENIYYKYDNEFADYKEKQSQLHIFFKNNIKLKNNESEIVEKYMREKIDIDIIDLITKNILGFPLILAQIEYLLAEIKIKKFPVPITDEVIAQMLKLHRGKYVTVITNCMLYNKQLSKYRKYTPEELCAKIKLMDHWLMRMIAGHTLEKTIRHSILLKNVSL